MFQWRIGVNAALRSPVEQMEDPALSLIAASEYGPKLGHWPREGGTFDPDDELRWGFDCN